MRPRRRLLAPLALVTGGLALAPAAHAAPYTVWSCANGSGGDLTIGDWGAAGESPNTIGDFCAPNNPRPHGFGAGVRTGASTPGPTGIGWRLAAPPGTKVTQLDLWWLRNAKTTPAPGRVEIYAGPSIFQNDNGSFGVFPPTQENRLAEANHERFGGLLAPGLELRTWCLSGCNAPASGDAPASFFVFRSQVRFEDQKAPTGSVTGLANATRITGPTPVVVNGADEGSGVRELSLRVDGQTVQRETGTGACADVDTSNGDPFEYNRTAPCPGSTTAQLTLNPAQLGDGAAHTVSVVVTDASGQASTIASARVAGPAPDGFAGGPTGFVNPDLDLAGPGAPNGTNAGPAKATLAYAIRRGRRTRFARTRVVRASTKALIRARLTGAGGQPIAGARVWRAEAVREGRWRIVGMPLVTSKTGRISSRLPSRRPSRDVRVVYFPSTGSNVNFASSDRRLVVRAATSIRLNRRTYRNRGVARFGGRISTRPLGGRREVILQARTGRSWQTFKRVRATTRGTWKARYRFRRTRRATRYRFRAVVPSQSGYSYATGRSRTATATVRP